MLDWLADFWEWVQGVFAPQEPVGYLVVRTMDRRDHAVVAEVIRCQPRAISTYRAIPQNSDKPIEIWVLCDHLFSIPGDPVRKTDALTTHRISVIQTKRGILPEKNIPESVFKAIWSCDYDLRDMVSGANCAVVVSSAIAALLIRKDHKLLTDPALSPKLWQDHADICVAIELKQLRFKARKQLMTGVDPKQASQKVADSIHRRRRRKR